MATNKTPATATTSVKPPNTGRSRLTRARMVQNFHLVWLDGSIDEKNNEDYRDSMTQLRQVVNTVNTFIDVDKCIDFITDIQEEKTFLVVDGTFSQIIAPVVQDIPQVSSVYIFSGSEAGHETCVKQWSKVHGVYTNIIPICTALKQAVQDYDYNVVSISFLKTTDRISKENLDTLDSSFMYTQILKEILLSINFEQKHINECLTYCREQFAGNTIELRNVDKIEKEYSHHQPIWWYTYNCFLYSMLNRTLRLMEVDLIIKLGFFVRDLHNQIATLYAEQYGGPHHTNSFIVYRGQGLSQVDFDQLMKTQGGLLSFNNFLSTSQNHDVSLRFARRTMITSSLVGVLFVMEIDPSISATPFANVGNVSYFKGEAEILFSMHSVFRIGQVKQIDKNDRLWQVDLTLTSDNDPQLHTLTERMREETRGSTGWLRLGKLMIRLGQFNKAEELYEILLQQTTDEGEKAHLFHHLGYAKNDQGKYPEAIGIYKQALEIFEKTLPAHHPHLASSYNNIALVYKNMGEYSKALPFHEKALKIWEKTLPANHLDFAPSYNNIGLVYERMGEYSKALQYFEKALEIWHKTLPANHPDLTISYNNIGAVYRNMNEYSKALSYYVQALEIDQKILPANHPDLATSYCNIGEVYRNIGEYSKALSYCEQALKIDQKTLPANHPSLATSYSIIGEVYGNMGEYSKALSYYEQALEIFQKALPTNHPDLATSYNNIGLAYKNMGEYSKALSYYDKALEIRQKNLPANHPSTATSYNNIGEVYYFMGEYSKALSYYDKALEIRPKNLPANHPDLATSYNNIGAVYYSMGEYSKALSYYDKALEIRQKNLPAHHPDLANSYNNIGAVYNSMDEYSKALSYYEQALGIEQKTLPANHPSSATSYNNIGGVYYNMGEYSKALSYLERALNIWQRSLPPNHPNIKNVKESIEIVKENL